MRFHLGSDPLPITRLPMMTSLSVVGVGVAIHTEIHAQRNLVVDYAHGMVDLEASERGYLR
jgi:hypothetical protein